MLHPSRSLVGVAPFAYLPGALPASVLQEGWDRQTCPVQTDMLAPLFVQVTPMVAAQALGEQVARKRGPLPMVAWALRRLDMKCALIDQTARGDILALVARLCLHCSH